MADGKGGGEAASAAGDRVPDAAVVLGGAGLIPFAGLAMAVWLLEGEAQIQAEGALLGYGAVILAFMGGCRWGFAAAGLGGGASVSNLAVSVVPALYGWAALLAAPAAAMVLLATGFAALLAADLGLARRGGAPAWWPRLRWPLTGGAVISLLLGALATV